MLAAVLALFCALVPVYSHATSRACIMLRNVLCCFLWPCDRQVRRFAAKNAEVSWLMRTTYISSHDAELRKRTTQASRWVGGDVVVEALHL